MGKHVKGRHAAVRKGRHRSGAGVTTAAVTATVASTAVVAGLLTAPAPVRADAASRSVEVLDFRHTAASTPLRTPVGVTETDLYYASPEEIDERLAQLQSIGVGSIRLSVPWNFVEPNPDGYDWRTLDAITASAERRGITVLATLVGTPTWAAKPGAAGSFFYPMAAAPEPAAFADFAGDMASRYSGRIAGYEIWNEPNGQIFYSPVSPEGYAELLKATYPVIKAADPNAVVVGGVVGATAQDVGSFAMNAVSFIERMYAAGAKDHFDGLSYHPYEFTTGIDAVFGTRVFSSGGPFPFSPINQLQDLRRVMLAYGDGDALIWGTEYGQSAQAVGENAQAVYIADMLATWGTFDFTGPLFLHTARDGGFDPTNTFGLLRPDGSLKPAAEVLRNLLLGVDLPLNRAQDPLTASIRLFNAFGVAFANPTTTNLNNLITYGVAVYVAFADSLSEAVAPFVAAIKAVLFPAPAVPPTAAALPAPPPATPSLLAAPAVEVAAPAVDAGSALRGAVETVAVETVDEQPDAESEPAEPTGTGTGAGTDTGTATDAGAGTDSDDSRDSEKKDTDTDTGAADPDAKDTDAKDTDAKDTDAKDTDAKDTDAKDSGSASSPSSSTAGGDRGGPGGASTSGGGGTGSGDA